MVKKDFVKAGSGYNWQLFKLAVVATDKTISMISTVLDLVSQVRDAILMNVYLEVRNPGGSGFWSWGYMSKEREMGSSVY